MLVAAEEAVKKLRERHEDPMPAGQLFEQDMDEKDLREAGRPDRRAPEQGAARHESDI